MDKRQLGRTGHASTLMVLGGVAFATSDQETTNQGLDHALARGVNHIDVAPGYRDAEIRIGAWLPPHRDAFFLGCKTIERSRDKALLDLNRSLKRLQTDHLDLYQLHAIHTQDELDAVFASGGAMEALQIARDQGKTRFLGITGHGMLAPALQLEALRRFDFDTVMFPINPRLWGDADYRQAAEELLSVAQERGVGVLAIKAAAHGPWEESTGESWRAPWYRPYETTDEIGKGVNFALSQPGVTAVISLGDPALMPRFLEAVERFTPLSPDEQEALIAQRTASDELIFDGVEFNLPD